jgi:MFS family permease
MTSISIASWRSFSPNISFRQATTIWPCWRSLAVFWFGFIPRSFGAIFFGHLGDLIGRKFTFMLTLGMMGLATFLGCIPSYETWGIAAPILILLMRAMQGLALGGEHGGAATYIAEHAPDGKRGLYTSWIQIFASALGTVFEWHDFYLYAPLGPRCREATKP